METVYKLTKKQIEKDKERGTHNVTQGHLDALLLNNRLTPEEYNDLSAMLNAGM